MTLHLMKNSPPVYVYNINTRCFCCSLLVLSPPAELSRSHTLTCQSRMSDANVQVRLPHLQARAFFPLSIYQMPSREKVSACMRCAQDEAQHLLSFPLWLMIFLSLCLLISDLHSHPLMRFRAYLPHASSSWDLAGLFFKQYACDGTVCEQ